MIDPAEIAEPSRPAVPRRGGDHRPETVISAARRCRPNERSRHEIVKIAESTRPIARPATLDFRR
jgi:hypothetical protein